MKRNFHLRCGASLFVPTFALALIASIYSATLYSAESSSSNLVTVFKHANFTGSSLSVGEGVVSRRVLRRSGVGNNDISSIEIEPGYEVVACKRNNQKGVCETITGSVADLGTIGFNDVIS